MLERVAGTVNTQLVSEVYGIHARAVEHAKLPVSYIRSNVLSIFFAIVAGIGCNFSKVRLGSLLPDSTP